ncbi:histidinol-phosphate aminotransferase [Spirochaetia bacterium]|nr:histidinol-phosphate aminotransferase [Spirochaetia bacterium]
MSIFWNQRIKALDPYVPGEQPRDRNFIKLNTNENPYPPSPRAVEAMERILKEEKGSGLRLYPDPLCTEFREAVAEAYAVKPEEVFPGNGSDEVLAFAFGAFFESSGGTAACFNHGVLPENDKRLPVFFPDITYSFYSVYARLWEVPYKTIPLAEDFSIDLTAYQNAGGVIIPNPNAPTGNALPADDLLPLAQSLEKNGRVLIVDEAYTAFGGQSIVPRITDHPNLLTVHTLSKSASLAGLRVGFAIGNAPLVKGLFRIRDSFNSYTMDRLALAGGAAAVLDKSYYDKINRRVMATRERSAAALLAMGFVVIPSKANFLFVSFPAISGETLFHALRDRGILVRHFNKPRLTNYLRVSIGTDKDMDIFLSACKAIVKEKG